MKNIPYTDLIPMDIFLSQEPITIDLVYANAKHPNNIFKEAIYHPNARLWAHREIAAITLLTARILKKQHGYILELKDCLRTTEAQIALQETKIVKTNPQWMEGDNRLLAQPGHGAHPRGMAIDVCLRDKNHQEIDMGTSFDHMDETSARNYTRFSKAVIANRQLLENAFLLASDLLEKPILPLPSEWWDFRFPASFYNEYAPLYDKDLPPEIRMYSTNEGNTAHSSTNHLESLAEDITALINRYNENI